MENPNSTSAFNATDSSTAKPKRHSKSKEEKPRFQHSNRELMPHGLLALALGVAGDCGRVVLPLELKNIVSGFGFDCLLVEYNRPDDFNSLGQLDFQRAYLYTETMDAMKHYHAQCQSIQGFLALPHPGLALFKHCIELEKNLASLGDAAALQNARRLYESALEIYRQDRDLWKDYHAMEIKAIFLFLLFFPVSQMRAYIDCSLKFIVDGNIHCS
ncbi:hypothetical protein KFK09_014716 [Dendrobium nobile]|uniref:Uncharacterized protein n=1 Tax=Dendrobium nobile TaxID=94219 RepID=A0A8T3B575_DENNO|nr:hypothetical protein KFK09_014716 [Dendrobium nobile]